MSIFLGLCSNIAIHHQSKSRTSDNDMSRVSNTVTSLIPCESRPTIESIYLPGYTNIRPVASSDLFEISLVTKLMNLLTSLFALSFFYIMTTSVFGGTQEQTNRPHTEPGLDDTRPRDGREHRAAMKKGIEDEDVCSLTRSPPRTTN